MYVKIYWVLENKIAAYRHWLIDQLINWLIDRIVLLMLTRKEASLAKSSIPTCTIVLLKYTNCNDSNKWIKFRTFKHKAENVRIHL